MTNHARDHGAPQDPPATEDAAYEVDEATQEFEKRDEQVKTGADERVSTSIESHGKLWRMQRRGAETKGEGRVP